jgi:hypothetical protein
VKVGVMNVRSLARRALFLLVLLLVAPAACAPMAAPKVSLRMKGNVRDASVTIDDRYVGALAYVASRGVALPPGKHRITVEKTGYFPWDRVVEASEAPIDLDVVLTKIPD